MNGFNKALRGCRRGQPFVQYATMTELTDDGRAGVCLSVCLSACLFSRRVFFDSQAIKSRWGDLSDDKQGKTPHRPGIAAVVSLIRSRLSEIETRTVGAIPIDVHTLILELPPTTETRITTTATMKRFGSKSVFLYVLPRPHYHSKI